MNYQGIARKHQIRILDCLHKDFIGSSVPATVDRASRNWISVFRDFIQIPNIMFHVRKCPIILPISCKTVKSISNFHCPVYQVV